MNLGDILDIVNERCDFTLSLNDAMHIARNIMELHSTKVRGSYSEGYDEGYKSGHEVGKSTISFPTPDEWEQQKLNRVYDFQLRRAPEIIKDSVQKHGTKKKIQVIKDVRSVTGLGLEEVKDMVDTYVSNLTDGLATWERQLLEQPHGVYDEPPF